MANRRIVKRARRASGLAMGAALMYFYDPQMGAKRRREAKERIAGWWRDLGQGRSRSAVPQTAVPETTPGVPPLAPIERVPAAS
jgi:hypothetical protein